MKSVIMLLLLLVVAATFSACIVDTPMGKYDCTWTPEKGTVCEALHTAVRP